MTPGARLAAAADALDRIAGSRAPADEVLKAWGRENRYAGAKDRRAIADRVYRVLRARQRLAWAAGRDDGRALVLASLALIDGEPVDRIEALYSGLGYAPSPLSAEERARLIGQPGEPPAWVAASLPAFVAADLRRTHGLEWSEEAEALLQPRAPVDLRVNTLKADLQSALGSLAEEGLHARPTPLSPWGLRLAAEPPPNIQKTRAFQEGWIEVQDEGSQLTALLSEAQPGQTVVDYCAGGGGKTLALHQMMEGRGRLVACDVNPRRLGPVRSRLARAGAGAEVRQVGPGGEGTEDLHGVADLVFVDAPCSGSGVWRRHPEAVSRLAQADVERLHSVQVQVLASAARLVQPGGRLVYVTCSVLRRENEDVLDSFETAFPAFQAQPVSEPGGPEGAKTPRLRLSPRATGTDGFFFAAYGKAA